MRSDGGVIVAACVTKELSYPGCGAMSKSRTQVEVDASADPEQWEQILNETLFYWECPDCDYHAQMVYPYLYHDKERGFLICLSPAGRTQQVIEAEQRHPALAGLKKRLVLTPAELKEKMMIFESGLNDVVLEMVKLALQELTERKQQTRVEKAFFSAESEELDYLGFSTFLQGEEKPVYQGVRLEIYEESLRVAEHVDFQESGFQLVDLVLARTLLEQQVEKDVAKRMISVSSPRRRRGKDMSVSLAREHLQPEKGNKSDYVWNMRIYRRNH